MLAWSPTPSCARRQGDFCEVCLEQSSRLLTELLSESYFTPGRRLCVMTAQGSDSVCVFSDERCVRAQCRRAAPPPSILLGQVQVAQARELCKPVR